MAKRNIKHISEDGDLLRYCFRVSPYAVTRQFSSHAPFTFPTQYSSFLTFPHLSLIPVLKLVPLSLHRRFPSFSMLPTVQTHDEATVAWQITWHQLYHHCVFVADGKCIGKPLLYGCEHTIRSHIITVGMLWLGHRSRVLGSHVTVCIHNVQCGS